MRLIAEFGTAEDYLAAYDEQISVGGLFLKGAAVEGKVNPSACTVVVRIGGDEVAEQEARLAFATPGVGVAVVFVGPPAALDALAGRLREAPTESEGEAGEGIQQNSARQRLAQLSPSQKMALALQCGREERHHLLRDNNKVLHAYVLRNPRIGTDEVQAAARLNSLSPEALKVISEHPEWGQNPTICAALVRNPKTPMPIALQLLPRIPLTDLRAIAKGAARQQIVTAARKLLAAR